MRSTAPLLALFLLAGCPKKDAAPAAEAGPPARKWAVEMPAEGKPLAEKLVDHGLPDLNPTGSSDFSMDFHFEPSGQWTAEGHAELGGETLDCTERGTWRIDEMVDAKGVVEWTVEQTNCPNRSTGQTERVLVGFEGSEATVSYR